MENGKKKTGENVLRKSSSWNASYAPRTMTTAPPTQLTLDARSEIATMPEKFKPLAVEISDRLDGTLTIRIGEARALAVIPAPKVLGTCNSEIEANTLA